MFLRKKISQLENDLIAIQFDIKLQIRRRSASIHVIRTINGAIRRHFGKQMNKETKLRIHNITAKAALKFGSEAWVLKKREEQRLEAAQMKFLRRLLGITKLDKEKNQRIRQYTGAQNIVKEIK